MKRCLIITGGKLDLSFAGSFLGQETFDKIIAVDAGLEAVKALGLEPDMIVGDFDTVKPEVLAYYRRMEHIVWDTHQPEKDETDTELALLKAQATGCTEVVVLGATGGRMDHMLGNIHLLFPCLQKGMEAYILEDVYKRQVKIQAMEYGIPVYQPAKVREASFVEVLKGLEADVYVVIAFGQILPKAVLELPKYGCINIHASLLPKYRGAAPIQWCVIDGERETGITTMMMDVGLDTGDMLSLIHILKAMGSGSYEVR